MVSVDYMLICILSVSVKLWRCRVLKHLVCREVKFILYPVLPFCHLFGGLTRLGLHELAVTFPLQVKPILAHLDRYVVTVGEPLTETLLL